MDPRNEKYARLFGGVFSRIEEYGSQAGINHPMYLRAVEMIGLYLKTKLNSSVLEDELVNWIDSNVLDDLRKDPSLDGACRNGHLEMAKWLVKNKYSSLSRKGGRSVRKHLERLFISTCYYGHLEVAKWLVETFPDINIHSEGDIAFLSACSGGHIDVVKWFLEKYPDTRLDSIIFYRVCDGGYLELAKFLAEKKPNICPEGYYYSFSMACTSGHLELAKWMVEKYPIDVCSHNNRVFHQVYAGKVHNVAEWLLENYDSVKQTYQLLQSGVIHRDDDEN